MKRTQKQEKTNLEERELKFKEFQEETWRIVREVSRQLGTIGNSNGDFAEEYFQNAFTKNPKLNGEIFDEVNFNLKLRPINGLKGHEYDIVLVNGRSVAIIEIKYHLKKDDIKKILSEILDKIETFKASYPECKNHKFYLGLASLSFSKAIENIIQEAGIAVIKQVGDKMVINSENLKVF